MFYAYEAFWLYNTQLSTNFKYLSTGADSFRKLLSKGFEGNSLLGQFAFLMFNNSFCSKMNFLFFQSKF